MSGTVSGGKLAAKKNKERHGEDFYCKLGVIGGRAKVPKGFALNRELASTAGRRGGRVSRRNGSNAKAKTI